jgi:large subunit ribosomal protein L5
MKSVKELEKTIFEKTKAKFGYKGVMQAPRILKTVVSSGIGSLKDKKKVEIVVDRLSKITAQKPVLRGAKKSIASFKTRQGDPVGVQVTLRGPRMYGFLDKFFNVALARTKDFHGISRENLDNMGNITMGIKEHTIFPETADEDLKDVFGLSVNISTSAKTKEEAEAALEVIGLPFSKKK